MCSSLFTCWRGFKDHLAKKEGLQNWKRVTSSMFSYIPRHDGNYLDKHFHGLWGRIKVHDWLETMKVMDKMKNTKTLHGIHPNSPFDMWPAEESKNQSLVADFQKFLSGCHSSKMRIRLLLTSAKITQPSSCCSCRGANRHVIYWLIDFPGQWAYSEETGNFLCNSKALLFRFPEISNSSQIFKSSFWSIKYECDR